MKKFYFLLMLIGFSSLGWGQTVLSNGDLALLGIDTPGEDFSFVSFVDLASGTTIYFTDEEADGDYTIGTSEGTVLFTASTAITAGTVITYVGNSGSFTTTSDGALALGNSGDGIIAYQGASVGNVTTYLHAIGKNASMVGTFPDGFSNYLLIGNDDGEYNGVRVGTASALLTSINTISNWTVGGSGVIPFNTDSFTISGSAVTVVQFTTSSGTISESGPTYNLTVGITNPDGSAATTCDVALTTGSAGDINSYATQSLTFPAGSSSNQTVTVTITDDSIYEGDETLVFTIQNVAGGNSASASGNTTFSLTITDNDDPQITSLPYSQDFATCSSPTNDWTPVSVASNRNWTCGSGYESINGFGGDFASDDYLISPVINLNNFTNEIISFKSWNQYADAVYPPIDILYTTAYTGNPATTTWTELSASWCAENGQVWTSSGDIDISGIAGITVRFAFHYTSTGTGSGSSSSWRIDDITIEEAGADPEPSNHISGFTATASSSSQIGLTWADNDGANVASGILILANETGTFADPVDGTAQVNDTDLSDGTGVYNAAHGLLAYNWTGLDASTTYYFKAFVYSNSGPTIDYKISGAPSTNATTTAPLATTSEVSGPALGSQPNPLTISSLITTDGAAVRVFDMDIFDYGVDTDPTKVTQLTIKAGTNNTANWANSIQGIKLSTDGGATFVTIGSPTIGASSIVIPVASGNLNIPNNDALTVALYIYLKSSGITDKQILEFKVDQTAASHGFVADATGSTFTTTFPTAPVSNQILIDVEATKLSFVQQPTNVGTYANISPAVTISANDANDNRDLDYTTTVSVSSSGLTGSPVSVSPVSGLATFSTLTFADAASGVTLEASSGTITNATSSSFNVLLLPLAGEIVINQFSPEYNGASNEYIELLNRTNKTFDLSLLKILYSSTGGSGPSSMGTLSGTLLPYSFWLLSPDATISVGLTNSINRNGSFTAGMSASGGQIGISTLDNQIIDGVAYGSITVNRLGEGTAASAPSTDGGLKRVSEGIDNNSNSTDFSTVANASIYLRNSNSVCIASTYTLPATSYPADVVISGTAPAVTLSGNTTITGKLAVLSGSLTVGSSQQLTVSGTLTNSAGTSGLVIESDATGTGSLLHNTANVPATIQRYITGNSNLTAYDYHLVSVPLDAAVTSAQFTGSYLYYFDPVSGWQSMGTSTTTPVPVDKGYMIYYPDAATTYNFAGELNNGTFTASTPMTATDQFALVPNPYPSAIDWDAAGGWTRTNLLDAIWIWDPVANQYAAYGAGVGTNGGTRYIPVGQAFFVKSNAAAPVLTMDNNVRVHNAQAFWKAGETEKDLIRVKAYANGMSDEILVRFRDYGLTTFDAADVDKLNGSDQAPQLYFLSSDQRALCINTLPYSTETVTVDMGMQLMADGTVTLDFTGFELFEAGASIFLEDLLTGQMTDLRANPSYAFEHSQGNDPLRFRLHFMGVTATAETAENSLKVWNTADRIFFSLPQSEAQQALVEQLDLLGRVIHSEQMRLGTVNSINTTAKGVVLLRVTDGNKVFTHKLFIR